MARSQHNASAASSVTRRPSATRSSPASQDVAGCEQASLPTRDEQQEAGENSSVCSVQRYRGGPLAAGSLLQYGITPIDSAKTDVTMQFYVENHPQEAISRLLKKHIYMSVTYVKFVKLPDMVRYQDYT